MTVGNIIFVTRARKKNEGFLALVTDLRGDGTIDAMVTGEEPKMVTLVRTIEYDKQYGTVWCLTQNWVPLNIEVVF